MTSLNSCRALDDSKQKRIKSESELPLALRAALKPPERLTVSQWADKFRMLDGKTSSMPGPWRTSFTPYAKAPMDAFTDPDIENIILMFGTQAAKTEIINNMIGYATDQDPGPTMVVYPEEKTAEFASVERLQPMFEATESIEKKFRKRESERLELRFADMYIALVGANSPSKLASRPIRYLFRDEIAKYKKWTGDEASPLKLTEERTKTFPHNKKIVDASTPKLKGDNIDKAFNKANVRYYYYVPCPHCGQKQRFRMGTRNAPGGIKWPEEAGKDPELVLDTAWYECEFCHGVIQDKHKLAMLQAGEWVGDKRTKGRVRSVAYHLNSIYSPFVTFGRVAKEFLESKDDPSELMNFVNSWLAETWEDKAATLDSDLVLSKQTDLPEGMVPDWAQLLTGGVDVQKNRMYWTIRAWGYKMTSQKVASGMVETWADLEMIMNKFWPDTNAELRWQVNLCAVDSGYDTETVYDFCLMNQEWAVPVKGSSNPMVQRYRKSAIEAPGKQFHGQSLYIADGDQYKNMIAGRLNKPLGEGCWMVHAECDRDYAAQVTAEHKIRERKNGRDVETWVKKTSTADNHYLDTEVYAALAADLRHVRYLGDIEAKSAAPAPVGESAQEAKKEWIDEKVGEGWFE